MVDAAAVRIVQAIVAPVPTRGDTTLHVTGVPPAWPPREVARYVVRAALELNCSKIAVHRPGGTVEFDAVEVVTGVARAVGYWPRPPARTCARHRVSRSLMLTGLRALGAGTERMRRWVTVPGKLPA